MGEDGQAESSARGFTAVSASAHHLLNVSVNYWATEGCSGSCGGGWETEQPVRGSTRHVCRPLQEGKVGIGPSSPDFNQEHQCQDNVPIVQFFTIFGVL